MNNNTVYEWILQTMFTVFARQKSLARMEPHLSNLVRAGDEVLDLCCGSGSVSFWFEEEGAKVTGMDVAPYMIALANEEARCRNPSSLWRPIFSFKTLGKSASPWSPVLATAFRTSR